ncbi:MAG: alanine racemase [Lachnospiraceae bacterium]|jgi:alanine racemase|nr:alanine racemase [Lachnospiraceae bacterium]MDE7002454.1 alanine racemase [Lachnospiraceae bacterium]
MRHYDRAWAEIDLDALQFNVASIRKCIDQGTKIIAVIKTDGYGHGASQIAQLLEDERQVWGYAVATAEEAFSLRADGIQKPILILGYTFPYSYGQMISGQVRATVFTCEAAEALSDIAVASGQICRIHIKIDTGMTRIGIHPDDEGVALIRRIAGLPGLEIEGIFTHFATADEADRTKTYHQMTLFREYVDRIERDLGIRIPMRHCSNSAGIVEIPEANMDAVRAGIILYGLWPSDEVQTDGKIQLRPMLSLKSRVVYVKTVPEGQEISYGGTFTTTRDTRVATVCIGYGDGYPRSLSNLGDVIIKGQRVPILGRVCMDQFMIDVTDVRVPVRVGDQVTLIGREGDACITMEELGALSGRFNYELACDIGKRIPRIYKRDGTLICK